MIQLEERLYTSTEVAEILGVSLRSVYRYLEENKLDAEIKTATGRHRFSKKNIMDFLYPDGNTPQTQNVPSRHTDSQPMPKVLRPVTEDLPVRNTVPTPAPTPVVPTRPVVEPTPYVPEPEVVREKTTETEEEPIDWLSKFREAAKKFKEESETPATPVAATPQHEEPKKVEPEMKYSQESAFVQEKFSGFSNFPKPQEEKLGTRVIHYRSNLGGLKDVAQNIDKTSRNSGIPYAFTMNAGLSLFKPIKPFSVLHAYVKPTDLLLFERALGLTPADETTSQLSLFVTSDTEVFSSRQEVHGLFVVSKERLMDDIRRSGDTVLTDEAKSVL